MKSEDGVVSDSSVPKRDVVHVFKNSIRISVWVGEIEKNKHLLTNRNLCNLLKLLLEYFERGMERDRKHQLLT